MNHLSSPTAEILKRLRKTRACFRYIPLIKRHDTVHIAPQRDLILDEPLRGIVTMSSSFCSAGRLAPAETAPFLPPQTSPFQRNCKKTQFIISSGPRPHRISSFVMWAALPQSPVYPVMHRLLLLSHQLKALQVFLISVVLLDLQHDQFGRSISRLP